MNADLRIAKRDRESVGKLQSELGGSLLDDETLGRLKSRFGNLHTADRPIFHSLQILNLLRLVIQHCIGRDNPMVDDIAKYRVGTAALMMSDFLLNEEDRTSLASGTKENVTQTLMVQASGPFEIQNSAGISHIVYRAQIVFQDLLKRKTVLDRIKKECSGFDIEQEFYRIVGIGLDHWLYLLVAFYAYLLHYIDQDGNRHRDHLIIDRIRFKGESQVDQTEIDLLLKHISATPQELADLFKSGRQTDCRFDFTPFMSNPLIELYPGKFFCTDLGFLADKMYSGVYWAINDGLGSKDRPKLFKAWGILFEEYVNSFLSERKFNEPLAFWPRPQWRDGTESFDGAFMQDSRFMPIEYKGGLLKTEARYSGKRDSFEADLDLKIGEGCRQLARKIESLFSRDVSSRKRLRDVPTDHITRIVPVLVVQDSILRGPLINWMLNKSFKAILNRDQLRPEVAVESLTLVSIHELEAMAESAEAGTFDIFHGLQLRCFNDPDMVSDLHNFLLNVPGYGKGKSERVNRTIDDQFSELNKYLFGKENHT
jgi:hypothetical protein